MQACQGTGQASSLPGRPGRRPGGLGAALRPVQGVLVNTVSGEGADFAREGARQPVLHLGEPGVVVVVRPHPNLAGTPDAFDVDLDVWSLTWLGNVMGGHGPSVAEGVDTAHGVVVRCRGCRRRMFVLPATKGDRVSSRLTVRSIRSCRGRSLRGWSTVCDGSDPPNTSSASWRACPASPREHGPPCIQEGGCDMCTATLAGGPLTCVRPEGHQHGHEFHSLDGSWVNDHHLEGGHG